MKTCCTYIAKELRVEPTQYRRYLKDMRIENTIALWKNDVGNAAAVLITDYGVQNASLVSNEIIDENGKLTDKIVIKAEFQKFINTYEGSNWIPEPRPFQPPAPPKGNRAFCADVIWGADIEESLMLNVDGILIQPLWITVTVSKFAIPGVYKGKIKLVLGNGKILELIQNIKVLDLELKDKKNYYLNLWQYPYASARHYQVQPFSEEHLSIIRNQMGPYIEAGGKTGTASIVEEPWYHQTWCDYPSMIKWIKTEGVWKFDYTDFDLWVEFLLYDVKVSYIECYSIVPWRNILRYTQDGVPQVQSAAPGTKEWEEAWASFLRDFVNHLDCKGWFEQIIVAMDERSESEMEAALNLIESIWNKDGKSLKVGGCVGSFHKKMWERLFTVTPHIANICEEQIPLNHFRAVAKERRKQGKLTSIYSMISDYPGIFSMSDPAEAAWTIWYAEFCGTDGFLKWAYDAWCENPLEDNVHSYFEAGDMFLVYPGNYQRENTQVRTTPRFRMMSEAIRDICKLRQIKENDSEYKGKVEMIINSVKSFYGMGVGNGVGTAGFKTASEEVKTALAEEVQRLHQSTIDLSEEYICAGKDM